MTVGELAQQVRDFLHVGASHDAADLVIINRLILQALNNARIWAERENDFALALVHGTVVASPAVGANLEQVLVGGEIVSIKSLLNVFYEPTAGSGELFPLRRRPRSSYVGSLRRTNLLEESAGPWGSYGHQLARTAPEVTSGPTAGICAEVLTFGNSLFIEPSANADVTLTVDGYRWMPVYQFDSDSDFFCRYCSDFLLWKAVIEVNHRLEIFAQRQEGTLPPPTTMRDEAWESALKWDGFLHEAGREYTLLT
jgi:hypothetical protein